MQPQPHKTMKPLLPLYALLGLSLSAAAQSFRPGDLYLYTPAFEGISSSGGSIVHIDPLSGAVTQFIDLETSSGGHDQIAYDPYRDRLIFQGGFVPNHTELYLANATGAVTSLGFGSVAGPFLGGFAATGTGDIYFRRSTQLNELTRLDAVNQAHPLLGSTGTVPFVPSGWHFGMIQSMEYHAPTHSLVVGYGSNLGVCTGGDIKQISLRRLDLSADGTRVIGEACWQYDLDPGQFNGTVVGLAPMSSGDLLMTIDNNSNSTLPRMVRVNPAAQTAVAFASNGHAFSAATNAGALSRLRNQAVILDTGNDVLRVFVASQVGSGVVFASGVSWPGSSGEVATLIEVGDPRTPYLMTAAPLTIAGAAGGTQSWTIDFGPANAGMVYLVLGSLHGWTPATFYGGVPVPLVADNYSLFTINNAGGAFFPGSVGLLDAQGRATAQVVMPASVTVAFVGLTAYHAMLGLTPSLIAIGATNAVPLTIQ